MQAFPRNSSRAARWVGAAALVAVGLTSFTACSQFQEGDCVSVGEQTGADADDLVGEVETVDCDSNEAEYEVVDCSSDADAEAVQIRNGDTICVTKIG